MLLCLWTRMFGLDHPLMDIDKRLNLNAFHCIAPLALVYLQLKAQDYPVATLLSRNFWTLSWDATASKLWKLAVPCFPAGCPLIPAPADCCPAARKIISCCLEEFCSSKQQFYCSEMLQQLPQRFPMDPIGLQKKLDDLVSLVDSMTKTTKEKHVDSPHFRHMPHSVDYTNQKTPHYNPTRGSRAYSPSTHQSDSATSSPHHTAVTHFSASFVETNRGHYCGRDHPSLSNIRVAVPPYRSSPSFDSRPSIVSSFGSVSYDSPLRPTPSHPSQPLASPDLDPASVILVEKCIGKKSSPEPETECIHFVDANDIADDEDFFEDETEVIKVDSLHDLNPELGSLEPLDLDTLIHLDPNLIKDIPLDKVYMDDINLISKEVDLTLNTLKLNSEGSDLIVSPTKETSHNSDLILNDFDGDNLEFEVSQSDLLPELDPDLIDPESFELRVIANHDPIENTNKNSEDINLNLKGSELNLNNEPPLVLLESIIGVVPLDLHLTECVLPGVREPCPYLHVASLTVVPAYGLEALLHRLNPIPTGDSLGYPIVVMSHDPSPYHVPDSYILPSISSSFPIKDHLSPSWLTLLEYTTATGRPSMTLAETSYVNALVAKDVFIAPPTPIPLNMGTLCLLIL
ncbi:hypothetical protein M5K25_005815 [Dendrobium thyrsiflorum]|uniref:Uncharacterized protein n=1 Tax=Dendrobium thyrsiflorum TaxID=117978 RepID=A0ABD0VIH1_DENTH